MAQTNFLVSRKSICVLGLLSVLLLIQRGNAYQFQVGGPKGSWTLPSDPNAAIYNQWAEKNRFQIGDTLRKYIYFDANLLLFKTNIQVVEQEIVLVVVYKV